ncbi:GrpE nucleotide exchange factor [Candidatus Magnetobacterium bavaricum]|uniref:GrpE nucleotide exchange factor n=1 Tax=Candidatus Magnetobacterium bavaricum TaxID=29290 RepID=A0A0F3GUB5_9BACT|nr:GrpE nucleotide exchange factor [Candidatus Magnetobacterium bavaricum]
MFEKAKERFKRFELYVRKIGDIINKAQEKRQKAVALIDYTPQEPAVTDKIQDDTLIDEVIDEIKDIKKAIRRQSISLEIIKQDIIDRIDQKNIKDLQPLMELADNFFFLSESFIREQDISLGQAEAVEIVWQKLDDVLSMFSIEVIREMEVPFDPAIHEAIESTCQHTNNPTVERVLQPGYRYRGNVVKSARVIIGDF